MTLIHPGAWTRIALANRGVTVATAVLLTVAAVFGLARLETEVGYRAYLGRDHPVVREFDAFVERFGGGLPLLAVWSCEISSGCASALDDSALMMASEVARMLSSHDEIRRVDSPATTAILASQVIGLPVMRTLVRDGSVVPDAERLRVQAVEDPTWVGRLISEDGRAGALVLHLRDSASETAVQAYSSLRSAVRPFEAEGFEFYFVGGPVEFVVAGDDLERNSRRIMPVMIGLIAIALMVLFGAPAAAAIALVSVGVALLWTLGAMGWAGWPQNSLTQVLPPLILVVGVCDAIHLIGRYTALRADRDWRSAIEDAAAEVGAACAMTTATTVAGFASLAISGLESIARFGVLAAVGVLASLLTTFTVLPVLVSALPERWFADRVGGRWSRMLASLAQLVTGRWRRGIVVAAIGCGVLGALGARDLQVDATFEDLYGETSDVVRWVRASGRYLRAPETLEISLQSPPGSEGFAGAEGFALVDRIQKGLRQREALGRSLSIVDVLRRLNRLLHGDELPLEPEGDEKGRPSSVYRLLRSRDPRVTDELVDSDGFALRISTESTKPPQGELRALLSGVRSDVERELPAGWSATITGPVAVVSRMIDAIRLTQLYSFALAAVAVMSMVAIFFRSLRFAFIAMVPTILPVLVTLGVMGWLGIALDIGSAMVASVVLGLAVDDAIHMLACYRQGRQRGEDSIAASRGVVERVGRPVMTTSIALAIGFTTLSLSSWNSIASFGVIASIAVLTALVAALVVLPAITSGQSE